MGKRSPLMVVFHPYDLLARTWGETELDACRSELSADVGQALEDRLDQLTLKDHSQLQIVGAQLEQPLSVHPNAFA